MVWRVEVAEKDGYYDAAGAAVKHDIHDLGLQGKVDHVKTVQVYMLEGDLPESGVRRICEELLTDPVTQRYNYRGPARSENGYKVIEVAYNPGVMDPVEESAKKAVSDLGIRNIRTIKTARKYLIKGGLSYAQLHSIAEKALYNKVIQHIVRGEASIQQEDTAYSFRLKHIDLLHASDKKLRKISKDGQLFLSLDEMRAIKRYFAGLKRNPTDCELETVAQTWSEHCKHKTFRGLIEYAEYDSPLAAQRSLLKPRLIDNLLKL